MEDLFECYIVRIGIEELHPPDSSIQHMIDESARRIASFSWHGDRIITQIQKKENHL